jgi:hypothetical protein
MSNARGGYFQPKPPTYTWTRDEEDMAVALYRNGKKIADISKEMRIPYRNIVSLLQRRMALKNRTPDSTIIAQMAKMYTAREICEKMNLSEGILKTIASKCSIHLCKTRDQLPRIHPMSAKECYRTFATLANAVAQADAERYAVVTKHTYMKDKMYMGQLCTMVEFHVINERHERLWDGLPIRQMNNDIYVKTPEGGTFCIDDDEITLLSNVINNNVTIIVTDNGE